MARRTEYRTRPCPKCAVEIIDVRDVFTGATYPVEAEFRLVEGVTLSPPPENRKRNPNASRALVYQPHLPICAGTNGEEELEEVEEGIPGDPPNWPGPEPEGAGNLTEPEGYEDDANVLHPAPADPELDIQEDDGRPG